MFQAYGSRSCRPVCGQKCKGILLGRLKKKTTKWNYGNKVQGVGSILCVDGYWHWSLIWVHRSVEWRAKSKAYETYERAIINFKHWLKLNEAKLLNKL